MERHKMLVFFMLLLQVFGDSYGQGAGGSSGQLVGQLGDTFNSLMSNPPDIQEMIGMLQNPAAAVANGTNSQMLGNFIKISQKLNGDCMQHMVVFAEALTSQTDWALRMIDAIGKPPSGLMNYKFQWIGDWNECVGVRAMTYENETLQTGGVSLFSGKYCPVSFPLPVPSAFGQKVALSIGTCFPDSCSSSDVKTLVEFLGSLLPPNITLPEPDVNCQENDIPLDGLAIAVIMICAIFLAIMTIATLYDVVYVNWLAKQTSLTVPKQNGIPLQTQDTKEDVYIVQTEPMKEKDEKEVHINGLHDMNTLDKPYTPEPPVKTPYKPNSLERLLLSFSVFTNGTKLLSTHQPKGALTAVNGIRFLSMSWVIVGHTFTWLGSPPTANFGQYAVEAIKRREFTVIVNGTFSVDTFFVLSGLLVSYLSLKELKKVKGIQNFKWGMYYFHRIWRLTPPYMLLLMLWVSFDKYLANGPVWPQEGFERKYCHESWWTNLLYINNLYSAGNDLRCFGWTWYLANDMQFYVISPLLLIPLYYSRILGSLVSLAALVGTAVCAGLISMYYELPASNILDLAKGDAFMEYYYIKPWCRVGPYIVGMFTGYLLYKSKLKMRINRVVNVIGWLVAIALGCLIVYGLYTPDFTNPLTLKQSALYNATARSVWGACIAWMVFSCANGYGGPINHILSWSAFVPLGRLTYFAYLVHPILMSVYKDSALATLTVYDYNIVYLILGHTCMSYATAFVLSMAFEAPMMGLEKVIFGRGKHS